MGLKEYSECNQLQRVTKRGFEVNVQRVTNRGFEGYSEFNQLQRVTKRGFEGVQ